LLADEFRTLANDLASRLATFNGFKAHNLWPRNKKRYELCWPVFVPAALANVSESTSPTRLSSLISGSTQTLRVECSGRHATSFVTHFVLSIAQAGRTDDIADASWFREGPDRRVLFAAVFARLERIASSGVSGSSQKSLVLRFQSSSWRNLLSPDNISQRVLI
jgi:hypothetical protein